MSFAYIVYVKSIKRDLQKLPETAIQTYKNLLSFRLIKL